jgi:hypothetical protein
MKICGFAICGLAHLKNWRICYSGMSPRIFGFAICGPLKKFASTPQSVIKADIVPTKDRDLPVELD